MAKFTTGYPSQFVYLYGAGGELLGTTDGVYNVYWAGRLIQQGYSPWVVTDRLGSVRKVVGSSSVSYLPYGEDATGATINGARFATYLRDGGTGLDYADQRYFTSKWGRFMTADPYRRSAKANDSGSWNKYSYTRGDPVNRADWRGLDDCAPSTRRSVDVCADPPPCYWYENQFCPAPSGPGGGGGPGPDPDQGRGGGGGNPGKSKADIAKKVIAAGNLALKALANSDCAGLFALTPGSPSPGSVLAALLGADLSGGIVIVNDIKSPLGQTTSATAAAFNPYAFDIGNGATQVLYGFVQVTINDLAGSFVTGSSQDQAVPLLHELGHVFSDLYGPGSTKITSDSDAVGTSEANTALVKSNCFH